MTIWPVPSVKDYLNILSNPTNDDIKRTTKKGMIRTFPKLAKVRTIYCVEKTFNECYEELKRELAIDSEESLKLGFEEIYHLS